MNPGPRCFRAGVGRGAAGTALGGPALVEEMGSVTVIPPARPAGGWRSVRSENFTCGANAPRKSQQHHPGLSAPMP